MNKLKERKYFDGVPEDEYQRRYEKSKQKFIQYYKKKVSEFLLSRIRFFHPIL
tara:strand:+ start:574 stop:732 length:159 start_codon:yes stop_codon:yes gene_type:complete